MSDLPADGVQFYAGHLPPDGTYADIADGREYGFCSVAALVILAVTVLAAVLIAAA